MDWSFIFEHISFEICSQIDLFSPIDEGMLKDLSRRRRKEILHGNGPASDRAQSGGKEEKESCYSAGRLLVTRGKSLIWPPAALISPSQLSFSSLTLHIGPFLVLIVTPFFNLKFSLSQIMGWEFFCFLAKASQNQIANPIENISGIFANKISFYLLWYCLLV